MIVNDHWLKTRMQLLTRVKKQVELRLGPPPEELESYSAPYQKEFQNQWEPAHWDNLITQVTQSALVLGSDFHAFSQSQRTHLRILRSLPESKPIILGMECVEAKHQEVLDQFIAGFLEESEFLKKVEWEQSWGFPYDHYRPLFELAKKRGYKVLGLNHLIEADEALEKRDDSAVKVLSKHIDAATENKTLLYVIFGEYHLAHPHLPQKLKSCYRQAIDPMVIYQNNENLYFDLAKQGLENRVHVLKTSGNKWCLIGSPPWVQWQSYLMFLEEVYDIDLSDEEDEEDEDGIDYTDHLHNQVQFIADDLQLSQLRLDDLQVYCSGDFEVWNQLEEEVKEEAGAVIDWFIKSDRSFILPKSKLMYLSRKSINHLAELAGKYLQVKLSQPKKTFWEMPSDFTKNIWVEALGFFASKLVNHHRKADTLLDLKSRLASLHPEDGGKEALLLALDQRLCEILSIQGGALVERRFEPKDSKTFFESAKILGAMFGEKIFLAYRTQRISRKDMVNVFKYSLENPNFESKYREIVQLVEGMDNPSATGGVIYER